MKTREDAKRVIELCEKRDAISRLSGDLLKSNDIGACDLGPSEVFEFFHLTEELRSLVKREAELQMAEIDKELAALGIAPGGSAAG